jgi:hypothetical protein
MKILRLRLISWIKHPILCWQAYQRRNWPIIDLDYPENNCPFCGYDHHYNERQELLSTNQV